MLLIYLKKKLHSSWLVAWLSGMVVVGVAISRTLEPGFFNSFVWLGVAILLGVMSFWRPKVWKVSTIIATGLLLGLVRGSYEQAKLAVYDNIIGGKVTARGVVSEDADVNKNGAVILRLKNVSINGHDTPGKLYVSLGSRPEIQRSDEVELQGRIAEGFGSFAATLYRPNIISISRPEPGDIALHVRDWFANAVRKVIPDPQSSLGIGYLVGQRRSLPVELDTALRIAGLTHVVVASGYNLTILVRLARRLFEKVSKYLATLASATMIMSFIAVTGLSPSMSRAGLVAGLSLAAWYYGRKFHPMVLLPFAAAVTVLINPSYAWNDLGWQLSFAAFAGVMIVAPIAQAYFFGNKKPGTIRQIMGETVAAQIATVPILIVAFGYISNVSVVANLLVLPLVPLAMLLTFIAGLGSLIVPSFGTIIAMPASWLLSYMVQVAEFLAGLSWAKTELQLGTVFVIIFYVLLIAAVVHMKRVTKFKLRDSNIVE